MFVTDTHPLAFYSCKKYSRLSQRILRLFDEGASGKTVVYVPTPALWEVHNLVKRELIDLPLRFDRWCRNLESETSFIIEPLRWQDVDEARQLPFRDPFDCLIAGTAIRLDLPLITKDQAIIDSGLVETIW